MRLTLVSHTDQVTRLECEGQVTQQEFTADHDPLEAVMGASIYHRCILLSLEKTSYIDSSVGCCAATSSSSAPAAGWSYTRSRRWCSRCCTCSS